MENASKALIMAGMILISVALISIFMYVFTAISDYKSDSQAQLQSNEVIAANRFFVESAYDIKPGQEGVQIHGYDVYNIIRKAKDIKDNPDSEFMIEIKGGVSEVNAKNNLNGVYTYSYTFDSLGYINTITFNKSEV